MPKPTVLIVDDNETNVELFRLLLEAAGMSVRAATRAEEGIAMARQLRPGVILMDIAMPGVDGLAATRILKADPETQDIPVVAVTSHARAEDAREARLAGCDGLLTKPVEPITFADQVAGYLRRSQRS